MTTNVDMIVSAYWEAKDGYDEALKKYWKAKQVSDEADVARQSAWVKLSDLALTLPDEAKKRVVATQFEGAPR